MGYLGVKAKIYSKIYYSSITMGGSWLRLSGSSSRGNKEISNFKCKYYVGNALHAFRKNVIILTQFSINTYTVRYKIVRYSAANNSMKNWLRFFC